jgi:hypothetical protein
LVVNGFTKAIAVIISGLIPILHKTKKPKHISLEELVKLAERYKAAANKYSNVLA